MMKTLKKNIDTSNRKSESGNVLFLILIAVALFAALSYAVTSSSRSGGGDANDETNLISSSTITQYPASIRTAIIRMQVSGGVDINELEFNKPTDFGNCFNAGSGVNCVFHPAGGGATHVPGSADVMVSGTQTDWVFNAENEINLVGTSSATENSPTLTSAEVIAFLPGIRQGICQRINDELGITGIPVETGINVTTQHVNADGTGTGLPAFVASGTTSTIGGTGVAELDGQAFGCFELVASSGNYVYFHVLIEQ